MPDLTSFLKLMVKENASDLHLSVNAPAGIKVEGVMGSIKNSELKPGEVKALAYSVMDEEQIATFEKELEMNLGISVPDVGRFRVNIFRQRGEVSMVVRQVRTTLPSLDELGLPASFKELATQDRGLVLVVGATGSGKSSTLAAMIEHRNQHMSGHILTVEDPIEFLFRHGKSIINQREVGLDTLDFHSALKNALREDPDAILIGEVRDSDTMRHALTFADTGHLCLTTLHANNACQALDRILNFFPHNEHAQLREDLSLNLKAIVAQRLVRGKDGKRVAAVELLINTPFVAELIRSGDFDAVRESMGYTQDKGMISFEDSLFTLFKDDVVSEKVAMGSVDKPQVLADRIAAMNGEPAF